MDSSLKFIAALLIFISLGCFAKINTDYFRSLKHDDLKIFLNKKNLYYLIVSVISAYLCKYIVFDYLSPTELSDVGGQPNSQAPQLQVTKDGVVLQPGNPAACIHTFAPAFMTAAVASIALIGFATWRIAKTHRLGARDTLLSLVGLKWPKRHWTFYVLYFAALLFPFVILISLAVAYC